MVYYILTKIIHKEVASLNLILTSFGDFLKEKIFAADAIFSYMTFIIRLALPVLAGMILFRIIKSLFREKQEKEVWGVLSMPNGAKFELNHWENVIGRSKFSDVMIDFPTVSRSHAAVIRDAEGEWMIYDLGSRGNVTLNGKTVDYCHSIKKGDIIALAGVSLVFIPHSEAEEIEQAKQRTRPGKIVRPSMTFVLLTEFQFLIGLQHVIAMDGVINWSVVVSFLGLIAAMWIYFIVVRSMKRTGFEIETIAFFLTTLGFSVIATNAPGELYKQLFCLLIGILGFLAIGWFMRDLDRAKKVRWPMAAIGVAMLLFTIIIAETTNGAKNWISIGGITVQPSEIVKVCFIFAGAATLDRLFAKRNLIMFMGFAGITVVALAVMSDFGTAAVFFVAYLVISYLRSGDFATIALSVGAAALAAVLMFTAKPYVLDRFSTWGNAWEVMNAGGYQQTRTMSAAASGGFFGVGAGNGWLHNVVASETDMVFGIICEELGLLVAVIMVLMIVVIAVYTVRAANTARSSYYAIAACAAAAILAFQVILNVFGSLDILPFTGVTFPFVSQGGSSLVACWAMLAFVKAVDTRQNASFAVRVPHTAREERWEDEPV